MGQEHITCDAHSRSIGSQNLHRRVRDALYITICHVFVFSGLNLSLIKTVSASTPTSCLRMGGCGCLWMNFRYQAHDHVALVCGVYQLPGTLCGGQSAFVLFRLSFQGVLRQSEGGKHWTTVCVLHLLHTLELAEEHDPGG